MKVALVQTRTGVDPAANWAALKPMLDEAADGGAALVLTPEMVNVLDSNRERLHAHVREEAHDPMLGQARAWAKARQVALLLGSLAVRSEAKGDERLANRSILIDETGAIAARYDKIHLFDARPGEGQAVCESKAYRPGETLALANVEGWKLGLTICFDVRFPLQFRELAQAGAQAIAVPSAFTRPTGEAHWHVLLRARAIETGCWILAPAQCGGHEDGRSTYGHSLIVDPWGRVVVDLGEGTGVGFGELDPAAVDDARQRLPVLKAGRPLKWPD